MKIYIASKYNTVNGVDSLFVTMIGTDKDRVELFAKDHDCFVTFCDDCEEYPEI